MKKVNEPSEKGSPSFWREMHKKNRRVEAQRHVDPPKVVECPEHWVMCNMLLMVFFFMLTHPI